MIEFWRAIDGYFRSDVKTLAFRSLLTGGMWNTEAEQGTAFPYGTFEVITDTPDHFASGNNYIENVLLQFNLFSNDKSQVEVLNLLGALIDCFDFKIIPVAEYTVKSCVRENVIPLRIDNVWQMNIRYRILLEPGSY